MECPIYTHGLQGFVATWVVIWWNNYNMVTEGLISWDTAPHKSQQGNVTHFLHRFSTQLDSEEQNGLSLLIAESLSGYYCSVRY